MKVFRLCREDEVKQILNSKSFENVGNYCRNSERNSHKYNEDVRYLHFFKNKSDLLYLNTLANRFICVYDIPKELLSSYYGHGKYRDYIRFVTLNKVEEFAIPAASIRFDYLNSIIKIIKDIDFEDMYENPNLSGLTQEIYIQDKNIEKYI